MGVVGWSGTGDSGESRSEDSLGLSWCLKKTGSAAQWEAGYGLGQEGWTVALLGVGGP